MPPIWTRRVSMSMTKRTKWRTKPPSVSTSTVKKSVAEIEPRWAFKKVAHGIRRPRKGAGSRPCSRRMRLIVLRARTCPRLPRTITDPRVAPGRVLGGEPDDELPKRRRRTRATNSAASSAVVLGGDEFTVPAQDRVGRHEPGELVQHAAAQHSALHREAAALVVGEPQLPATELLAEDAVAVRPAPARQHAPSLGRSLCVRGWAFR